MVRMVFLIEYVCKDIVAVATDEVWKYCKLAHWEKSSLFEAITLLYLSQSSCKM